MKIILRKTSLVDYPGCVSSVFFFSGCNLRCPWCHNGDLVLDRENKALIPLEEGFAHLQKRHSVLGGVVLSGGEPCIQAGLPDIIAEIKKIALSLGRTAFPVKLDTNGMFPAMLENLLNREETRPDYIALDLKLAPPRYSEILPESGRVSGLSNMFDPGGALLQSAALIRGSGLAHEYRTLALPGGLVSEKDIEALASLADEAPWYFRPFRSGNCLDPAWDNPEWDSGETRKQLKTMSEALAAKARELGKTGKAH